MSETALFAWGLIAFLLAVGPLVVAALLDYRERGHRQELERAAGLRTDENS